MLNIVARNVILLLLCDQDMASCFSWSLLFYWLFLANKIGDFCYQCGHRLWQHSMSLPYTIWLIPYYAMYVRLVLAFSPVGYTCFILTVTQIEKILWWRAQEVRWQWHLNSEKISSFLVLRYLIRFIPHIVRFWSTGSNSLTKPP